MHRVGKGLEPIYHSNLFYSILPQLFCEYRYSTSGRSVVLQTARSKSPEVQSEGSPWQQEEIFRPTWRTKQRITAARYEYIHCQQQPMWIYRKPGQKFASIHVRACDTDETSHFNSHQFASEYGQSSLHAGSSSSSIGTTAHCGLWPVKQCPTIFFPICHQLSPSSHSQHLKISFYFLFPSFPGSLLSLSFFQVLAWFVRSM